MIKAHTQPTLDLPLFLWAVFPPLMILLLILMAYITPEIFELMLAKDIEGGIVEHSTVLILLPGIAAGFAIFFYHRKNLPAPWLGWWVLMWTMASVYFAGEEISWGQWLFRWETPEILKKLNSQEETNLHNITPWLSQKPQSLVEILIFIGGLVLPLWWRFKDKIWVADYNSIRYWLFPTYVCIPAAAIVTVVPFFKPIIYALPLPHLIELGTSELHEYYIALFLCLYLLSIWFRIRN